MARRRRYFESGRMYEITIRARTGLPFPHWCLIQLLLASALARTQRSSYVTLCHFLWMANHAHILVVVQDADSCKRFYMELQKKITDYMKRLLGRHYLDLWEGEPAVIAILDLDKAVDRVRYLYSNPAKANLVETIRDFPGYSTWSYFSEVSAELTARYVSRTPWVRQYHIQPLKRGLISRSEDERFAATLREKPRKFHELAVLPNAWMRCFNITEGRDVAAVNRRILGLIQDSEESFRNTRKAEHKGVLGAERLRREPITKEHTPKKNDQKIFAMASDKEVRIDYIQKVLSICEQCADLARRQRRGERVCWPPGVFPSPLPMMASALTA